MADTTSPNFTTTLTHKTATKLAFRVAIVIILMTALSYYHVASLLTAKSLEQLEKYTVERGQRESEIFKLVEANHKVLKDHLVQQLQQPISNNIKVRFDALFEKFSDGVTRNRVSQFDGTKEAFTYIGKNVDIDQETQRRVLSFYDISNQFGPAWHHRLQNIYFTTPNNIRVGYWPDVPNWSHDASADLYMPNEEYVWVADIAHDPGRNTVWTGLFYDVVGKTWMVSAETPVDIDNQHIATIGHDITLNELLTRTIDDHLEGAHNIIFRADGRLVAHPQKIDSIKNNAGNYNILTSGDAHLQSQFNSVINKSPLSRIVDNIAYDEYLAVQKLNEPNWYFVTVYPKSLIATTAFSTAKTILLLGALSLCLEILILVWVLRQNASKPMRLLVQAVNDVTANKFDVQLDTSRNDELGYIAHCFNTMSMTVLHRSKELTKAHHDLEHLVEQRTQELSTEIAQHKITERELKEKERRLRTVLDTVADGIVSIDSQGIIESFNPAAEKIFQYEATQVIGQNIKMLMTAEDSVKHDDYIQNYIQSQQSKVIGEGRQLWAKQQSGTCLPIELTISDAQIDGRNLVIGVMRDISNQIATEEALQIAKETAEQANMAKSTFLSNMSHELRTPLNAILGFSQLLILEDNLSEFEHEAATSINKAGNHLLDIINEILDLSKIEVGRVELNIVAVDIISIIMESLELTQTLANSHGISLQFINKCQSPPFVQADYTRLMQVLLNLLSNAVKYNKHNGQITAICEQQTDSSLRVSIMDTGFGIENSDKDALFTPFSRLHTKNHQIEGTGLGLVITKHLIEHMGGIIGVDSNFGEGSTFWIELSIAKNTLIDKRTQCASNVITDLPTINTEHTILYIEDNATNIKIIHSLLNRTDYLNLVSATSGEEGIQAALKNQPDIILLDITLPKMNGYEVLEALKNHKKTANIPVVALTANAMQHDINKGLAAGFTDYITKPIDLTRLMSVINRLLNGTKSWSNTA